MKEAIRNVFHDMKATGQHTIINKNPKCMIGKQKYWYKNYLCHKSTIELYRGSEVFEGVK